MVEIFEVILCIIVISSVVSSKVCVKYIRIRSWYRYFVELRQKQETKESLDQFTHKHSEHWEYVKDVVPWRFRLRLSRFRGKERALTWRIKLLALFAGLGPQVAEWILEEYMITAKVEEKPAPGEWTCPKCGTHNQETALFCKNCGEYK